MPRLRSALDLRPGLGRLALAASCLLGASACTGPTDPPPPEAPPSSAATAEMPRVKAAVGSSSIALPAPAPTSRPAEAEPAAVDSLVIGGSGSGPAGTACASSSDCAQGLHCTTEDGVCDRPPGCGPDDICPMVCFGVCAGPTPRSSCTADDQCRVEPFYCEGCTCLALGVEDPKPKCTGRTVSCLVNPCDEKTVRCVDGTCTLAPALQ